MLYTLGTDGAPRGATAEGATAFRSSLLRRSAESNWPVAYAEEVGPCGSRDRREEAARRHSKCRVHQPLRQRQEVRPEQRGDSEGDGAW